MFQNNSKPVSSKTSLDFTNVSRLFHSQQLCLPKFPPNRLIFFLYRKRTWLDTKAEQFLDTFTSTGNGNLHSRNFWHHQKKSPEIAVISTTII